MLPTPATPRRKCGAGLVTGVLSPSQPAACPPCVGHMSSPAAQVSSLVHSTQSSLPDVVHLEEGKETGKSTVSERRFRQGHRESLGKDRNKETKGQNPGEKERQRQKPERERRQMKQKTGREWTERPRSEARSPPFPGPGLKEEADHPYLPRPARGTGDRGLQVCQRGEAAPQPTSPDLGTRQPRLCLRSSDPGADSTQAPAPATPQPLAAWPF